MSWSTPQSAIWELVRRQHGVVARGQLLDLGLSVRAIEHRLKTGRLHLLRRGVYAVGRPEIGHKGRWMAAVLSCGRGTVLSHRSAAALWGIGGERVGGIEVSTPFASFNQPTELRVHRRYGLRAEDVTQQDGIPVTSPIRTLLDLAAELPPGEVERAVNEADRLGLVDPETLREALGAYRGERGVRKLRTLLDRRTFRLTDSELERRFLCIVAEAGLSIPETGRYLNGFKIDFYWPDLGLVVETDGLRYHRTPAQQARDRLRDQAHVAAGMTPLRFTHQQVRFEAGYVRFMLLAVANRLAGEAAGSKLATDG